MKIVIDLEKETVDDLKLAISKIEEEINRRKSIPKINLTEMLLKNKKSMLQKQLKKS